MLEWLAPMARGIITHSTTWAPRLRAATSGRVDVLPLAYPDAAFPPPRPLGARLVIATIGHVNPNKQADQVLRAIASDATLRAACEYRLLGHIERAEQERLTRLAQELGIAPPLFTGWLAPDKLHAAMAEVDVIACLRHPLLEAGSASLITALHAARPTLVSHQGVYAEVPADLVFACAPGQEAADVARHLRRILDDPASAQAQGQRGQAYAAQAHSAASYVNGLLAAVTAATSAAPAIASGRRLGQILGHFALAADDPAATRIARSLSEMLGHSLQGSTI